MKSTIPGGGGLINRKNKNYEEKREREEEGFTELITRERDRAKKRSNEMLM